MYTFQDIHFRWCMWIVILYNINFCWNCFCQILAYLPVCYVGRWYSQLFDVGCDRCYCHQLFVNHLMLLANVICHVVVIWLMIFANVADGIAIFLLLWQMKTTFLDNWCCCDCGRWKTTMWMADVIAIVVDGITTLITGWCYNQCSRWNSHMCDSWCYC